MCVSYVRVCMRACACVCVCACVCEQCWLCDIERSMRTTLKDSLRNCRLALQKMTAKRDKWVRDWPGQVRLSLPPVSPSHLPNVSLLLPTVTERHAVTWSSLKPCLIHEWMIEWLLPL